MLILHNKAKQIFIPLLKILVAILSMAFIIQKAISQEEYYDVLRKSQQSGDTRPFIYFIYRIATRSIREYIDDIQLELQDNEIQPLNYNLNI